MKNSLRLLCLAFLFQTTMQAQDFTWIRGSSSSGQVSAYGTQGVPSATTDPGARHGCAKWVDANGDLWLFGGEGYDLNNTVCWLNDLWKYNRATNQWTWMRGATTANSPGSYGTLGVAAATNDPPAREFAASWTDQAGNLWLFGGENSAPTSRLNDLWKYNPATNMWTWVKGSNLGNQLGNYGSINVPSSSNVPGGRSGMATWVDDSGNLCIWGGRGYTDAGNFGFLSDMWKYNTATNQWTWIGGPNLTQQSGAYGTQGVPSATNIPSGRDFPAYWKDHLDRLYICGGRGSGYFSDLWRYDPNGASWVWLKGPNIPNQLPVYGTTGTFAVANNPGGRFTSASWIDQYGYLWMFGGTAWTTATISPFNMCNDLWRYDPCTNMWAFMKGAQVTNVQGIYGQQGVSSPTVMPGSRFHNNWWKDPQGDCWLFGGEGYDASTPLLDHLNDLWKFTPLSSPDYISPAPSASICSGNTATLTAVASSSTVNWYSSPTSTTVLFNGNPFVTGPLTTGASNTVISYYAQASCANLPRVIVNLTVSPFPVLSVAGPSAACTGGSISYTAAGATSFTWNSSVSGSVITIPVAPSTTLQGSNSAGCISTLVQSLTILPAPALSVSGPSLACPGSPVNYTASGASTYTWNSLTSGSVATIPAAASTTLEGTSAAGCYAMLVHTLSLLPAPIVSISGPTTGCMNTIATFTASGAPGYSWSTGSNASTATLNLAQAISTISVVGTNSAGCSTTSNYSLATLPAPVVVAAPSRTLGCKANPVTTITITASGATSYTWNNIAVGQQWVLPGNMQPVGIVIYTLTGKAANGCIGTSTFALEWVVCVSGIGENDLNRRSLQLFPNPAPASFNLLLENLPGNKTILIYDALAKEVYRSETGETQVELDLRLASGVYQVLVSNGSQVGLARLVVE